MAAISLVYNNLKTSMFGGGTRIDLDADVIKARLVNTTVDYGAPAPGQGFMTPCPKYLNSTDQILTSPVILTTSNGNFNVRSVVAFDAADPVFPAIAADAGKPVDGICIYKFVTNDADSLPLLFLSGFTGLVPASAPITVTWANTVNRIASNLG